MTYRLVVVDSRKASQSGAYLEDLGNYNPSQKTFNLKEESIKEWISKGAQTSDTVHNFLIKNKVIKGKKINVSKKKKKKEGEEEKVETPAKATGVVEAPVSPEAGPVEETKIEQAEEVVEEVAPVKKEEVKPAEDDKKIEKEEKPAVEEKQEEMPEEKKS